MVIKWVYNRWLYTKLYTAWKLYSIYVHWCVSCICVHAFIPCSTISVTSIEMFQWECWPAGHCKCMYSFNVVMYNMDNPFSEENNELERFHNNPHQWLNSQYPSPEDLPTHLIMYNSLTPVRRLWCGILYTSVLVYPTVIYRHWSNF